VRRDHRPRTTDHSSQTGALRWGALSLTRPLFAITLERVGGNALHLGILTLLLAFASSAHAATPGDDLRVRIAAAAPGATIEIEPGVYDGPFVIDTPLRLVGRPGAILQGDRLTHVVAVRAPDVEIAGLTIRGSGTDLGSDHAAIHITGARTNVRDNRITDSLHGIYVRKADDCRIERNVVRGPGAGSDGIADPLVAGLKPGESELCDVGGVQDRRGNGIHLWNSVGHTITGNRISGTRDGIYFSFTDSTLVRDNTVSRVRYGLHYMYSDDNTFEENTFNDNAAGAALMYSKRLVLRANRFAANRSHRAYGLLFQSVDDTTVEANTIEGNTLGFYLENSNNITVRANRIAYNYVGLRLSDSTAGGRFFANDFHGNLHAVETNGRNAANSWSVAGRGNQWQGALALDLDRDGVADLPHREPDLFGAWRRGFPAVGLLSASPGERLLRFIHSRIALAGMPGVTDPHPIVVAQASSATVVAQASLPASSAVAAASPSTLSLPAVSLSNSSKGSRSSDALRLEAAATPSP
jgi:nitrous oxidase accessory protein